jgi:sugar phosphate isomerase/epimerase
VPDSPVTFALSTHIFHGERLTRRHLETIKDQGFDDIEIFATRTHVDYADAREIGRLGDELAALGITPGSMHAPICASFLNGQWGRALSNATSDAARRQEAVDETARAIAAARSLRCAMLVLHLGLPRGQSIPPGDNDRRAVTRSLEQIAEAAGAGGVQLALEVIPNDLSTPAALLEWLEGDLDLRAGLCLDVGHAHLLGGAPEAVEALAGHVLTTHVHDNRGQTDDHLVPFAGTIDWPATLAALWKIGFAGRLVFEVADAGDAPGVLTRTVGARMRLQGILDELSAPFDFSGA